MRRPLPLPLAALLLALGAAARLGAAPAAPAVAYAAASPAAAAKAWWTAPQDPGVLLTWTASGSGAVAPLTYRVYRATFGASLPDAGLLQWLTSTAATAVRLDLPPAGTPTWYYVDISDSSGASSPPSAPYFAPALASPDLSLAAVSNSRVELRWTGVAWADSYTVYRATPSGAAAWLTFTAIGSVAVSPAASLASAPGAAFIDAAAVSSNQNVYVVQARLAGAGGGLAGPASLSRVALPWISPTAAGFNGSAYFLTAAARPGAAAVDLFFTPARQGSGALASYEIFRGNSPASLEHLDSLTLTAADPVRGLLSYADASAPQPFNALWYGVQPLDLSGVSGTLLTASVGTAAAWPAPAWVSATVSSYAVKLQWGAPRGTGSYPFSHWWLGCLTQSGAAALTLVPAGGLGALSYTSYIDYAASGLNPVYYVRAVDSQGLPGRALSITVALDRVPAFSGPPSAPPALEARVLTPSAKPVLPVSLAWQPNALGEGVSSYILWRQGSASPLTETAALAYLDSAPGSAGAQAQYLLQARNAQGVGLSRSASLDLLPPAPAWISAAASIDASGNSDPQVRLAWQDLGPCSGPGGVDSYTVLRGASVLAAGLSYPAYTDVSPSAGSPAAYSVQAVLSGLSGPASAALALTVPAAAPVLSGLQAVPAVGGARLSWSADPGAADYWVYRSSVALGSTPPLSALLARVSQSLSYADSGGGAGQVLYYAVAAASPYQLGAASGVSLAPLPATPAALAAAAFLDPLLGPAVALSWSAPPGGGASAYRVYRSSSSPALYLPLSDTAGPDYTDAVGALTNTALAYRVSALGQASAEGPAAGPVSATAFLPPAAPLAPQARGAGAGVEIAWQLNPAAEGVTGYAVAWDLWGLGQGTSPVAAGVNRWRLGDIALGQGLSATVLAYNAAGASPASAEVTASAGASAAPPAPAAPAAGSGFYAALSGACHVDLAFSPLSSSAILYRFSGAPLPLSLAAGGASSPLYLSTLAAGKSAFQDFGVAEGQTYAYALTALGPGGLPDEESLPAVAAPGELEAYREAGPASLSAAAGDGRVDLWWSAPGDQGSAGLAGWKLYRYAYGGPLPAFGSQAPDAGFPLALDLSVTAFSDLGPVNGASYAYYLAGVDARGRTSRQVAYPQSPLFPGQPLGLSPQGLRQPPGNLTAVAGDRTVILRWVASKADAASGGLYNVYRRPNLPGETFGAPLPDLYRVGPSLGDYPSSSYNSVSLLVQSVTDFSLSPSANTNSFCYCLSVVNAAGEGPKSRELCVTPFKPLDPRPATQLKLEVVEKKDVRLSWTGVASQSGLGGYDLAFYRLYRSADGGNTYQALTERAGTAPTLYSDAATEFGAAYVYRLVPVDAAGNEGLPFDLASVAIPAARNSVLVFRNAFNPARGESVLVQYSLQQPGRAWVKVFTLGGQHVRTLFDEEVASAAPENPYVSSKLAWDGRNSLGQLVASGVYLIHLESPGYRANARVAVIK